MTTGPDIWDLYAGAVISCEIDGMTRRLGGPDAGSLPAPAPVFVLTAHNPMGEQREESLNVAAERALEDELTALGLTFWPATGRSRDASWSEPGVAVVGLDRSDVCALGARFGQLAVYELTVDHLHVVRCADGEPVRTRSRREENRAE